MNYYAVRYGGTIRVSQKVKGPASACLDCFGICYDDMEVNNLGPRKSDIQSHKRFTEVIQDKARWKTIGDIRRKVHVGL
jgi:hypothetical protein